MAFSVARMAESPFVWLILSGILLLFVGVWVLLRRIERLRTTLHTRSGEIDRLKSQLQLLAMTDPLTQLRNENYLELMLSGEVKRLKRLFYRGRDKSTPQREHWSGLLAMAPDYMNQIEEEFGPEALDQVWIALANFLQDSLRETDIITRAPDDAFVLFLPNVGFASLTGLAQKLLSQIRDLRIDIGREKNIGCTCSVGFCLFPYYQAEGYSWEDLVYLVRVALTTAQNCGRDKALGLDYGPDIPFQAALEELKNDPRHAIDRGVFIAKSVK